jgi:TonB family protein
MKTNSFVIAALVGCIGLPLAACKDENLKGRARLEAGGCMYLKADQSEPGLRRPFPRTEDYRPRGESGHADVNVCVAADGKQVGEPTVLSSSGSRDIDRAVVAMMKAGRYCPAMDHGVAVERCFKMRIGMGPDSGL